MEYRLMEEEQLMEEHIFGNLRILDSSGKPYKTIKELARVDIFRVRELSFKPGRKSYNKDFNSIKGIKKHLPVLSSQLSQENNFPFNIILNKNRMSINCIKQKDIYIEIESLKKFNDRYKQNWESIFKDTSLNWSDVRTNIHQTKISLDIKSAIYSQIHLGYFSEYLLVKRGTIQSATCKLCHETLHEHYHEILHCRVLFKVLSPWFS